MSRIAEAFERSSAERGTTPLSRSSAVPIPWPLESSASVTELSRAAVEPRVNIEPLPIGPAWPREALAPRHEDVTRRIAAPVTERPQETVGRPPSSPEPPRPVHVGGTATPRTVADVLRPGSPRSWQEAVDIVQAAAAALRPGSALPAPEDLWFDGTGAISFASQNDSAEDPVASLAVLLMWLLDGTDAPPGLMQLASDNATAAPRLTTVQALSNELAQYEQIAGSRQLFHSGTRVHDRPGAFRRIWVRARRGFHRSR